MFSLIQAAVAPQPGEEGIKLKAVIGYNGSGRGNMVWSPDQGYHNNNNSKIKLKLCGNIICQLFKKKGLAIVLPYPKIDLCCRFVCVLVWLCGGGGVPSYRKSETLAGPQ